ncbi:ferritin-like domain-containing protein [Falsirhodobacter halotolerans]|uniref:ferritin-like domain-containing protein n=1 Tax=Falsirhodobacter halotolerans TaxID=1146892 RepID=UPI001FD3B0CE|nr:ferritin-like domain-containing protein [Falsirhodobacter halotolerans]MCJ8139976.1 ferritin-like domain-containing protein [Falsirhodobacter halotolerans]
MTSTASARDIFVDGLRNAHAMEKQALSIMEPQVKRLEHYPDVSAMLDRHIRETEGQIARLDEILDGVAEGASTLKDVSLSFTGSMAAVTHSMASDEILKNSMANFAFENFEIAAYTALITTAEEAGAAAAIPLLEQTLDEERRMAAAIQDSLPDVVRQYIALSASDQRADI